MHRFKINKNEVTDARAPLSQEEAAHALKVLRLRDGETVQALDGEGGMWMACLRVMDGKNAYLELKEAISNSEAPIDVTVYMGIPKGDKFEFLCQKLTELGVRRLFPVRMERSVAKSRKRRRTKNFSVSERLRRKRRNNAGAALRWRFAIRSA